MTNNITWHEHKISRGERERLNGHKGCVIWFTGLSASGKSTIANIVEQKLYERGARSYLLDGDNVRYGLNAGSGYSRRAPWGRVCQAVRARIFRRGS